MWVCSDCFFKSTTNNSTLNHYLRSFDHDAAAFIMVETSVHGSWNVNAWELKRQCVGVETSMHGSWNVNAWELENQSWSAMQIANQESHFTNVNLKGKTFSNKIMHACTIVSGPLIQIAHYQCYKNLQRDAVVFIRTRARFILQCPMYSWGQKPQAFTSSLGLLELNVQNT